MTDPIKPVADPKAPAKKGPAFAVALIVAGILAALLPDEGRKLRPYLDSAGIWTVCMGITGPDVWRHKGVDFTVPECKQLEEAYVTKQVNDMGHCIDEDVIGTIQFMEWIAYGHWAYNTGIGAFCHSTLNRRLNAGDHAGACKAMASWTFITVKGRKVNCRNAGHLCPGIVNRRDKEVEMCLAALP